MYICNFYVINALLTKLHKEADFKCVRKWEKGRQTERMRERERMKRERERERKNKRERGKKVGQREKEREG